MFQYDGKPVKKWSAVLAAAWLKPYPLAITTSASTGTAHPAGSRFIWSMKNAGTST